MLIIISFVAIIMAIAYGFKTGKNAGFVAIVFAYLIGSFGLGMSPSAIIKCWPIKTFFYVLAVSLFFHFAVQNGTLEKLSLKILYYFRGTPKLLLFVLFFTNLIMAAMGVGNMPIMAMFASIMIMICAKTNIDYLVGAMTINYGSIAEANFMTSVNGMAFRGLLDEVGYTEQSFFYSAAIFAISIVIPVILLMCYTVFVEIKSIG